MSLVLARRPRLHEVGPLVSNAAGYSPTLKSGAITNRLSETEITAPLARRIGGAQPHTNAASQQPSWVFVEGGFFPQKDSQKDALLEDDSTELPPVGLMDDEVPADFMGSDVALQPVAAATTTSSESVLVTRADRIEAVCSKIDPAVRAFIEEQLRGRFVGVQDAVRI